MTASANVGGLTHSRPLTHGVPHVALGLEPTPVHALDRLSERLGGPRLLIKRDDLSGLGAGGNKVRKLRVIFAEVLRQDSTVVLSWGGVQSNSCAQVAVTAAMLGMPCELFLLGEPGQRVAGNLVVHRLARARVQYVPVKGIDELEAVVRARARSLEHRGERPYVIPLGGSTPAGVMGTVAGIEELAGQVPAEDLPTHIVVAGGSMGTLAGLALGAADLMPQCRVDGVSVLWPADHARDVASTLIEATRQKYLPHWAPVNVRVDDDQLGEGYGVPTVAGARAQALAMRTEGLLLDATYTAKAMAGLVARVRDGFYSDADRVLFWHTGGIGGLLAGAH